MTPEEIAILQLMATGQLPPGMAGKLGINDVSNFPLPTQANPAPQGIVQHNTAGSTLEGALNTRNPFTGQPATGYNYYVGEDERVYQRAPPDRSTIHMRNPGDPNRRSGVAENLTNQNTLSTAIVAPSEEEATLGQQAARGMLTRQLIKAFGISPANVWGHGELQTNRRPSEGRDVAQAFRLGGPQVTPQTDPNTMLAALMPPGATPAPVQAPAPVAGPTAAGPGPGPQYPRPAGYGPPTAQPTNPEAQQAGWGGWLQDPVNRAFLLQMGLQLMTPTWGGPMAQLAAGIGAGAEAASGTAKQIREEEDLANKINMENTKAELDRKNRLQVAQIGADSRTNVAQIRGEYSLQRAASAAGVRNSDELRAFSSIYDAEVRAARKANQDAMLLGQPALTDDEINARAEATATAKFQALRRAGVSRPGQNAIPAPNSSVVPAPAPGPGGGQDPSQTPPAAQNNGGTSPRTPTSVTPQPFWPGQQPQTYSLGKGTVQGKPPTGSQAPAVAPAEPAVPQGARMPDGSVVPEGTVAVGANGQKLIAKGGKWVVAP